MHFFSLILIIPDLSEKKLKSNLKKVLFTDFLCIDVNKQLCYTVLASINRGGHRMKKAYKAILLLGLLAALFLAACHVSKDAVSLKNEKN